MAVLALESLYSATKKLADNSIIEKLFNLLIDLVFRTFVLLYELNCHYEQKLSFFLVPNDHHVFSYTGGLYYPR